MSFATDIMDTDMLEDRGPWFGQLTTSGNKDGYDRPSVPFSPQVAGESPQGGIDYIDQAVGGYAGPRTDAFASAKRGILSAAQRLQPFNGAFLGTTLVTPNRVQGPVGASNGAAVTAARARAASRTNIPDNASVAAAFTNPALNALIQRMKGQR